VLHFVIGGAPLVAADGGREKVTFRAPIGSEGCAGDALAMLRIDDWSQ
jgi:hypothetical protein